MKKQFELLQIEVLQKYKTLKQQIKDNFSLKLGDNQCPAEVTKAIEQIIGKLKLIKISQFHPPFLPKSITKYRHQYFLPIKRQYHNKFGENQFTNSINILHNFIVNFDVKHFDVYLQQIREPYIKKVINENYQFDQINFKEINEKYKIKSQMESLLNSVSGWLLEVQTTQDLLERITLYFDIKTPSLLQKMKKQAITKQNNKSWSDAFNSIVRNLSSYALRKSSKFVQSSFFTTLLPATAMLTMAMVGGSSKLPWPTDLNINLLIAPTIAFTVPFVLDNLAELVQRKEYIQKLQLWSIFFEEVSRSIRQFNEQIEEQILLCSSSKDFQTFSKQKLNLQKYVKAIEMNLQNITNFDEQRFDQMRDRTEAYFKKYIEIKQGQWIIVIPQQQMKQ